VPISERKVYSEKLARCCSASDTASILTTTPARQHSWR
jgi:hypothetical protein